LIRIIQGNRWEVIFYDSNREVQFLFERNTKRKREIFKRLLQQFRILDFYGYGRILVDIPDEVYKFLCALSSADLRMGDIRKYLDKYLNGEIDLKTCLEKIEPYCIASIMKKTS